MKVSGVRNANEEDRSRLGTVEDAEALGKNFVGSTFNFVRSGSVWTVDKFEISACLDEPYCFVVMLEGWVRSWIGVHRMRGSAASLVRQIMADQVVAVEKKS